MTKWVKPDKVKIIQITSVLGWTNSGDSDSEPMIHGLGDDGVLYVFHRVYTSSKRPFNEHSDDPPEIDNDKMVTVRHCEPEWVVEGKF